MRVDIVTHCWRFSRALTYQLSSLVRHPPKRIVASISVLYSPEDEPTFRVIEFFRKQLYDVRDEHLTPRLENVRLTAWPLPTSVLVNRTIGRNSLALTTTADCIWMADADYYFGDGCLDSLVDVPWDSVQLGYPETYWKHKTHEIGESVLSDAAAGPFIGWLNPEQFEVSKLRKAIGGCQIFSRYAANQFGYCKDRPNLLQPYDDCKWRYNTRGDTGARKALGTNGTPLNIPNLYRIRQFPTGEIDNRQAVTRARDEQPVVELHW